MIYCERITPIQHMIFLVLEGNKTYITYIAPLAPVAKPFTQLSMTSAIGGAIIACSIVVQVLELSPRSVGRYGLTLNNLKDVGGRLSCVAHHRIGLMRGEAWE